MYIIQSVIHPAVILSTARIVNVQIDAYDLVLRFAALFQLRPLESPSKSLTSVALAECILVKEFESTEEF